MQLRALDQFHISSVKPDTIRPGEVFECSDFAGGELLKLHPNKFERVDTELPADQLANQEKVTEPMSAEKAEPAPQNKAEPAPANKADTGKKAKDEK
jgi:hypothetical protein